MGIHCLPKYLFAGRHNEKRGYITLLYDFMHGKSYTI